MVTDLLETLSRVCGCVYAENQKLRIWNRDVERRKRRVNAKHVSTASTESMPDV